MTRRTLVGVLAALVVAVVVLVTRGGTPSVTPAKIRHKIDLVAAVTSINTDVGWSQANKITSGGSIRMTLDDLRVLTIPEGTMVDDYSVVPTCASPTTPNTCVILADMLGDSVVWFALVQADKVSGNEFLTLPGLVDMQANGDEGILRNGWILKLATPVKRECGDLDTSSLRDFITRFPDTASTSIVDLIGDKVTQVRCV